MAKISSLIRHAPNTKVLVVRQDLLGICKQHLGAAVCLSVLEFDTNYKAGVWKQVDEENLRRAQAQQPPRDWDLWVYKSIPQFVEDSLGVLKEWQVREGLEILLELGYIQRRNNPQYPWDRTWQYRLDIKKVNAALDRYARSNQHFSHPSYVPDASVIYNGSKRYICSIDPADIPDRSGTYNGSSSIVDRYVDKDVESPIENTCRAVKPHDVCEGATSGRHASSPPPKKKSSVPNVGTSQKGNVGTSKGKAKFPRLEDLPHEGRHYAYPPEFEEFWGVYPRPVEKAKAYRKWRRNIERGASVEELLQAAQNYALATQGREPRYIKHPATFLNPVERPWADWVNPSPEQMELTQQQKNLLILQEWYKGKTSGGTSEDDDGF